MRAAVDPPSGSKVHVFDFHPPSSRWGPLACRLSGWQGQGTSIIPLTWPASVFVLFNMSLRITLQSNVNVNNSQLIKVKLHPPPFILQANNIAHHCVSYLYRILKTSCDIE